MFQKLEPELLTPPYHLHLLKSPHQKGTQGLKGTKVPRFPGRDTKVPTETLRYLPRHSISMRRSQASLSVLWDMSYATISLLRATNALRVSIFVSGSLMCLPISPEQKYFKLHAERERVLHSLSLSLSLPRSFRVGVYFWISCE